MTPGSVKPACFRMLAMRLKMRPAARNLPSAEPDAALRDAPRHREDRECPMPERRSLRRNGSCAPRGNSSGCGRPGIRAIRRVSANGSSMLPSTRIRITPCAARRSANGSFDPLGIRPTGSIAQRVQFVSQRENAAVGGGWNRILHAERLVVLVDGARNRLRLALLFRVQPADDPLEIGEFLHHVGGQIALRQQRRALRMPRSPPSSFTSATTR